MRKSLTTATPSDMGLWWSIVDYAWLGFTVQRACEECGVEWSELDKTLPLDVRKLIIETAVLAGYRQRHLGA